MFRIRHHGDFKNTEKLFENARRMRIKSILEEHGRRGVFALAAATPKDSGITSNSWNYEIKIERGNFSLTWTNSNENDGVPIAILIQYGHATKEGGYVQGRDFVNPAIKPIFDAISDSIFMEVSKL